MKTVEEIKKRLAVIESRIANLNEEHDICFNGEFDIGKLRRITNDIGSLKKERQILEWVLNESV